MSSAGWPLAAGPLVSLAVTAILMRVWQRPSLRNALLDRPNTRSLHAAATPRTGGLAVVPGLLAGLLFVGGYGLVAALAAAMMGVSLLDDWKGLPVGARLAAHLCVAMLFVALALPGTGWVVGAALVLAVAWMTNLYNFMDGADGLAGGMAAIGFAAYAMGAWMAGQPSFAAANLCVAAAAAAFLPFNFPPARVFMGDAGSIPLGFLAAALGLAGWQTHAWPLWFPLVVFAPFVVDASATLARRAHRREKIWQPHRSHYYQRLVLTGWSHRRLALAEYLLMLASALAAFVAITSTGPIRVSVLLGLAGLYAALMTAVDRRSARQIRA
jgi:UDP-N-acetylmuramyl pentapeptide phosphotransferase/UDP-N-acetylglucosamine-1-phosphate transferase